MCITLCLGFDNKKIIKRGYDHILSRNIIPKDMTTKIIANPTTITTTTTTKIIATVLCVSSGWSIYIYIYIYIYVCVCVCMFVCAHAYASVSSYVGASLVVMLGNPFPLPFLWRPGERGYGISYILEPHLRTF